MIQQNWDLPGVRSLCLIYGQGNGLLDGLRDASWIRVPAVWRWILPRLRPMDGHIRFPCARAFVRCDGQIVASAGRER